MAIRLPLLIVAAIAVTAVVVCNPPATDRPLPPPPDDAPPPTPATDKPAAPLETENPIAAPPPPVNPGPAHTGVVVDSADQPVAGALVSWTWGEAARWLMPAPILRGGHVWTDEKGRFRLAGRGPAAARRLYIAHRKFGTALSPERDASRDPLFRDLRIRLEPMQTTHVLVSTAEGERPERVEIALRYGKRDPWAPIEGLTRAHVQEPMRTAAEFTIPGLTGESFTLWIRVEGYSPRRFPSSEILPGPGMGVRWLEVTVERGLAVSGTLVDREGKPVAKAVIHVNDGDRRGSRDDPFWCMHGRTDEKGRFTVGGLPDGTFLVRAHARDGKSAVTAEGIRAGAEGLKLRLPAE